MTKSEGARLALVSNPIDSDSLDGLLQLLEPGDVIVFLGEGLNACGLAYKIPQTITCYRVIGQGQSSEANPVLTPIPDEDAVEPLSTQEFVELCCERQPFTWR